MKLHHGIATGILALALLPGFASSEPLRIEPASTRVGVARVSLEISDLRLAGDRLHGTYRVRVPLAPAMNDRGSIEIDLEDSLGRTLAGLGTVAGVGRSALDGRDHLVTCHFGPDRRVDIVIDTGDRILTFRTRYF
jgi:hypothetical protein